ncbi:MAG TPA: hypothetical protein GXX48_14410 [Ochrobactrum intermedium]|uniref:ATP-binding protein n=2 Tax=Brucella TaxID=234 RepID=A0A7V6PD58_9HYPH|nr:hypothetical protein [Brucella intermedia]HHV68822.1 hypothetical protein [Brucella intermedia]
MMGGIGILDTLAAVIGRSALRKSLDGYCRLVTSEGENMLVADDGSLVTVFRLEGFRSMPGEKEISKAVTDLRLAFSSQLGTAGYTLQFWFGHTPELGAADINRALAVTEGVAADTGLDIHDLIDERRQLLPKRLTGERCFMALWSRPTLLTRQELKTSSEKARKDMQGAPQMRHAQWPALAIDALVTRHRSFCEAMVREANIVGIEIEPLEVHEALSQIKGVLNPEYLIAGDSWKAILPGDYARARMPKSVKELKKSEVSNLLWPLLSRQLINEHGEIIDQTTVQLGETVFSGFDISLGPEVVVQFNDLIRRVLDSNQRISWRMSMLIDSGGFQGQMFKETYTNIMTWTAPIHNSRIKKAFEKLRLDDGADDTVVRWRCSFAAWAPKTDIETLQRHVATLRRTVERWGNCQTDALVGDPVQCVMSSALALNAQSTAPAAAASLADAFALAPIARPASPWQQGSVMFRTKDGKLWPYQPGSSKQLGWVDLIVGTPGSGKSVLMNSINLGVALSRQSGRSRSNEGLLPRISIIDIGPSSSGLISLIRDALPVQRRHEAVFHRLKMSEQYSVNPLDLQLCMRHPFEYERAYLVNLLCLICTPDGEEATYDGISALAGATIDEAYKFFSDSRSPKRYSKSDSFEVDAALEELGFEIDTATTWYEITDYLFSKGRYHEDALAQRYAVPTLADLVNVSNSEIVREPFRDMKAPTGEDVLKAFQRMLTAACRDYPILARPTRFDVSNARIIAFDLAGVTAKTGPHAKRQTAIMYMVSLQTLTTDFWMDADEIRARDLSDEVRAYHLQRIENNRQMGKRLCVDEYHLTGGLDSFRDQMINLGRVGRKAGVQITLASQLLEDFDTSIQKLANSFWFCNVPTEESIRQIASTYNLTPSIMDIMRGLRGPIEGEGAPLLAMLNLRSGTYVQHVFNQLGPIEIWALSTTAEDTSLRTMLYESLGSKAARRILARRFPSGSAKDTIERRLADMEDRGVAIDDKVRGNAIRQLADELIKEAS